MSRHSSLCLFAIAALACAAVTSPSPSAGTISIAWDPVDHSELAGYRVFYDTTPGTYGTSLDAGNVTAYTVSGLVDCQEYHVAVKAYDSTGVLSEQYSQEVIGWARPEVGLVGPEQVERGTTAQLAVNGKNFRNGVQVDILDPAIDVLQVTEYGCHQLLVDISVGTTAGLGPVDVRVVNPDQTYGDGVGAFNVIGDDTGPGISSVVADNVGSTTAEIGWQTDEVATSRVFFRLQGEGSYQSTPLDETLVTDHLVLLQGLAPSSTYEFYVESADASGNTNVSGAPTTFTTDSSPYAYIRFEAEDAQLTSPIASVSGDGAFRRGWIQVPAGTPDGTYSDPAGTAEMGFHLPHAATWHLWVRTYGAGYQSDSWFESVDGAAPASFYPPDVGAWYWVEVRSYALDAGLHMLTLGGSEAETRADRILVTDDPDFVPTEEPGDDVTPPDAVTDLAALSGNGFISLSWTNPAGESGMSVVIRYSTDGQAPLSPVDGLPVADMPVTPGSAGSIDHTGLINGSSYSYSVFVIDAAGNASSPATVQATPWPDPPGTVQNVVRTDVL